MNYKRLLKEIEALRAKVNTLHNQDVKFTAASEVEKFTSLTLKDVIKTQEQADTFMKILRAH